MPNTSFGAVSEFLWKWGERLWKIAPPVLAAITAVGTGWAAAMTAWLSAYGPVSWVFAGLLAALIFSSLWWVIAAGVDRYARARWIYSASKPSDAINPLDSVFTGRKIDMNVFRSPMGNEIVEPKTFVDCHLMGPMVILFTGHSTLANANLVNCDFVMVEEGRIVQNVTGFRDINIRGGKVYLLTILVPRAANATIPDGANWITLH